jgi:hypothetical protein
MIQKKGVENPKVKNGTAPIAPIAPINGGDTRNEKDLPVHEYPDISFQGPTAEMGAMVAIGAKEEPFILGDDKSSFQAE